MSRSKHPVIVLPHAEFFDGTLLAFRSGAVIDTVHFLDDERMLVLGRSTREVVVHAYRLENDQWRHTGQRHALPRTTPPEPDFFLGFHRCGAFVAPIDQDAALCVFMAWEHAQVARFDFARGALEPHQLEGAAGYFCGEHEGVLVFTRRTSDGTGVAPLSFVRSGLPCVVSSVPLRPTFVWSRGLVVGHSLGAVHAIDPNNGHVVRSWHLHHADVHLRVDGDQLVARASSTEEWLLDWDAPEPRTRPVDASATNEQNRVTEDTWLHTGVFDSAPPKGPQLRDRNENVLVEVRSKSRATPYGYNGHSASGRWWVWSTLSNFVITEHGNGLARVVPRSGETRAEDRAAELYPGFAESKRRRTSTRPPLAIALYEALVKAKLAEPFSLSTFASAFPSARIDPERMGLVREAVRCVQYLAETSPRLKELTTLVHQVNGNAIHAELYPQWDGEDATFDVTDLSGIDVASGLTHVSLALANVDGVTVDVSPLAKLSKLERLDLRGPVHGLASLCVLGGTLREITLDAAPDAETLRVLRAADIQVKAGIGG